MIEHFQSPDFMFTVSVIRRPDPEEQEATSSSSPFVAFSLVNSSVDTRDITAVDEEEKQRDAVMVKAFKPYTEDDMAYRIVKRYWGNEVVTYISDKASAGTDGTIDVKELVGELNLLESLQELRHGAHSANISRIDTASGAVPLYKRVNIAEQTMIYLQGNLILCGERVSEDVSHANDCVPTCPGHPKGSFEETLVAKEDLTMDEATFCNSRKGAPTWLSELDEQWLRRVPILLLESPSGSESELGGGFDNSDVSDCALDI